MARTPMFRNLLRTHTAAQLAHDGDSEAGVQRRTELDEQRLTRRRLLRTSMEVAAFTAAGMVAWPGLRPGAKPQPVDVGIVGAGLAGLSCADKLASSGLTPIVYEAGTKVGGRCSSLAGRFPGQVAERGGEFIDTAHKTMIGLAKRFGLALEDVNKGAGEVRYRFGGVQISEAKVVEEYRIFVQAMRTDLRRISQEITADRHTAADIALDRISLSEYLDGRNALGMRAGALARAAIVAAYEAESGLAVDEQSCLNFLMLIHADRRGRFQPFGVSDERYHVVNGNDRIATGLAGTLPRPVTFGHRLVAINRASDGRIALTFATAGATIEVRHERVVVTLPFSVLRDVAIAPGITLDPAQAEAIRAVGYGTNAKLMVGLTGRPWKALGCSGESYSDLGHHQATWETNPASAGADRAILTDYLSAQRGAGLNPANVNAEAEAFVRDCNLVIPGVAAAARRQNGLIVSHLAYWPSDPRAKGSYTCYRPGQFTTLAGHEGRASGNLHFAGEHTDSYYGWQGYLEGACNSGLRVADEILAVGVG